MERRIVLYCRDLAPRDPHFQLRLKEELRRRLRQVGLELVDVQVRESDAPARPRGKHPSR